MINEQVNNQQASLQIPRFNIILLWLVSIAGSLTILTHIAQLVQLNFRTYSLLALLLTVTVSIIAFFVLKPWFAKGTRLDIKPMLLVTALGLVSMGITLMINYPSNDVYYYIPNAIYYLQHPLETMGFKIHFLYSGGEPFTSVFWATSGAYEYIQGAFAHILRINYLTVYFGLNVAIVGFMIPCSIFMMLTHFSKNNWSAAIGTLITFGSILLLGEMSRTYGIFYFLRPYEGKAVLFSIGMPLFVSFSLFFLKNPNILSWISLFWLATALSGVSSSAVFLIPALALVLAISYTLTSVKVRQALRTLPSYFATMGYLALYVFFIFRYASTNLGVDSPANVGYPTTFGGQLMLLINTNSPLMPIALIASTDLAIFLLPQKQKWFLGIWILSALVLFLNPIVAPFLITYITSPNAYWRLFYIYPFPLTIGIFTSLSFSRIRHISTIMQSVIIASACALLVVAHFVLPEVSIFREKNVTVGMPAYKVFPSYFQVARQAIAIAPKGPMLAPSSIAGYIVMLESDYPQLRIGETAERVWLASQGRPDEAEWRINASDYIGGGKVDNFSSLQILLEQHDTIRSIIINKGVFKRKQVNELLAEHHFTSQQVIGNYIVVWK